MRLSRNSIYECYNEAMEDIEMFHEVHPKSKQKWEVKEDIIYRLVRK